MSYNITNEAVLLTRTHIVLYLLVTMLAPVTFTIRNNNTI